MILLILLISLNFLKIINTGTHKRIKPVVTILTSATGLKFIRKFNLSPAIPSII